VTYTLTVTNNGTGDVTGVTLTDTLPLGVSFVSATGGVAPVRGVLTFHLGGLAAGASSQVTIIVTPTAAGALTDSAAVTMDQADPTPDDNLFVTAVTAVAPSVHVVAPTVTLVERFGIHTRPTTLVLSFDKPLDPARAQDLGDYQLVALVRRGRTVRIRSAVYDPAARTVTLRPARRLMSHRLYRLTVIGTGPSGVADTSGILLDGQKTGHPGSNFVMTI
jgi:hypothetical protein